VSLGGRYRAALGHRDMRLLVSSFIVDGLGSWAYSTVMMVYVYQRTGSATWVAMTAASRWIPGLVLAPLGGVIADRFERTRVMIVSALTSAFVVAVMTVVVAGDGSMPALLVLSAFAATVYVPYRPAAGALTPDLVLEKELAAANALFSALESLTVVVGPALGGLLLLAGRPSSALALDAASFGVAAVLVSRIRTRSRGGAGADNESVRRQLFDGFEAVRRESVAGVLIMFCALDSAIYGASTVLYAPISQQLGTGVEGYSYLLAGSALGGLVAAALADRLSRSARLSPVIVGGICLQALPFAFTVLVHNPVVGFGLQVVSGAGMIIVDVLAITALQRAMPRAVLSRVLSLFDTSVFAAILTASFLFAALFSVAGLRTCLLTVGLAFPLVAVLGIAPMLAADRRAVATVRELAPRVSLLRALDLFAAASRTTLERLAAAMAETEVPGGTTVIAEGDTAHALYVLVSGEVDVTADHDGSEQFLRTMSAPAYFGEIGLLTNGARTATVRARGRVTLWELPGQEFLEAVQGSRASTSLVQTSAARLARSRPRTPEETSSGTPST